MKFFAIFFLFAALVVVGLAAPAETAPDSVDQSTKNHGKISIEAKHSGGETVLRIDGNQQLWSGKYGHIDIEGGLEKQPGQKAKTSFGASAVFEWR